MWRGRKVNNTLTLWQLLNQQEIVVPMIQRDYAQGRIGKEHIRSTFLNDVEKHLASGTNLTLDFVYGNAENGKFHPLDGQQRLTTLWLVYWYVAFRLNKLKVVKETLKRFSYQTRTSSSKFCEMLCDKMAEADPSSIINVAEYIKRQTWFFSEWMQDPTVNSMLRTLSGNQNSSVDDHIQGVLHDNLLDIYWENLTQRNVITFELMFIGTEKLPISDDLYIKMNARGKKLTDFENFKADWVADIWKNPAFGEKNGTKTYKQYYTEKIDQDWTDVFWNSREKTENFDGNIDSIFFSFINRFVLNQHCLKDALVSDYNSRRNPAAEGDKDKEELQRIFDTLYGTGLGKGKALNDDSLIEYKGFATYREYLQQENLAVLDEIFCQLKNHPNCIKELSFSGLDEDEDVEETSYKELAYYFLPQYTEESGLHATKLKERIYFHAICLFLEDPNWNMLNDWKRIVWNLVENAAIENIDAMISCLREINGLGKWLRSKNWNIYEHLADYKLMFSNGSQLIRQWEEEKIKAAKIQTGGHEIKECILEAEKYAFFKGTIRFLYTGPNGETDWDYFAIKFQNAKLLFGKGDKVDPQTIQHFLGTFKSFDELKNIDNEASYFFTTVGYHKRNNCWKKDILCRTDLYAQTHAFLMGQPSIAEGDYLLFLNSGAIEVISEKNCNYNYRCHYSKGWGIHRDYSPTEGIYCSSERLQKNRILLALQNDGEIQITSEKELKYDFLWGKTVSFTNNGKQLCWSVWSDKNWIYPAEDASVAKEWSEDIDKTDLLHMLQTIC